MGVFLRRRLIMQNRKSLNVAFVNPPHADWSLGNNIGYLMFQSHYNRRGKYADNVNWIPAPYKWNQYQTYEDVYEEIKTADIVLFSSYVWNYTIVDGLCKFIKEKTPSVITVVGGPHIGTNETLLMVERYQLYDYICQPTKPGETFIEDLINEWFDNNGLPQTENISWAIGSVKGIAHDIGQEDYSVYEDHIEYLTETLTYSRTHNLEPFVVLETTRGCPYKCVFCEWGGGIGTKIFKKEIASVKRDIIALKAAGFRDAYLTDANFGAFEDRDIEIFGFAWSNNLNLTDISTVKSKSLDRRKRLIDKWFDIVGPIKNRDRTLERVDNNMWDATENMSVVPTVSIQSISDEAMRVADRVDLTTLDKLELSRYISKKCAVYGYPIPALELILAMPGSTIQDFYAEMEVIWNFKAWGSYRHDYMFLPDSKLNSQEYKDKYQIETVEVYSDVVDEDGIDNWSSLYKNKKTYFKTIRSCYSFTRHEIIEMWFMNCAANYLLQHLYTGLQELTTPSSFAKICWKVVQPLHDFQTIIEEIEDIFNPDTPPRSIRQIQGRFRVDVIEEMLENNLEEIKSEVLLQCLLTTN